MTESGQHVAQTRGPLSILATAVFVAQVVLIALLMRTFFIQSVSIPSASMMPTLLIGDYLLVNKASYGYGAVSLPFAPKMVHGRLFGRLPERGDIAVFRSPRGENIDYIKRVIGLPGDRVQMIGGVLHLNGEAVPKIRMPDHVEEDGRFARYRETLPNGVSYMVLDLVADGLGDNTTLFTVPEGHLFMMGDNRDNSVDSRFPFAMGYVPLDNLIGRAFWRYFSLAPAEHSGGAWSLPAAIRWSRLFTSTGLSAP